MGTCPQAKSMTAQRQTVIALISSRCTVTRQPTHRQAPSARPTHRQLQLALHHGHVCALCKLPQLMMPPLSAPPRSAAHCLSRAAASIPRRAPVNPSAQESRAVMPLLLARRCVRWASANAPARELGSTVPVTHEVAHAVAAKAAEAASAAMRNERDPVAALSSRGACMSCGMCMRRVVLAGCVWPSLLYV